MSDPTTAPGWRLTDVDEGAAAALAARLSMRPLTARIMVGRGFTDPERAGRYLQPRLGDLRPPTGIADLETALERLARAVRERETVGVFGDYDVDGVTSAAVMTLGLRAVGATVIPRAASRHAGYGLTTDAVTRFADDGCAMLVTCDCGTSDLPALNLARERGLDVVVIDHHQIPEGTTPAHALINPHRADDTFPFKGLASCGLAFYLVAALRTRVQATGFDPRELLDLVALGSVADMVPLTDENRILTAVGLRVLAGRGRPGVRALAESARLGEGAVSASDLGFRLTPRLNAAGRLGEAQLALDLLLAEDDARAAALCQELEDCNRERQRIQERVVLEAMAAAAEWAHAPAIVVGGHDWHPGVVGIVAARLVDAFAKPAVVVGFTGEVGRGSARTIAGVDLFACLSACADRVQRFGGHAAAAGVTLAPDQLPGFREAFMVEVQKRSGALEVATRVAVDGVLDLTEVDVGMAADLERLGPFGVGNLEPLLAIPGVTTTETRVVGQGHLQLTLARGGMRGEAIAFNMAKQDPGVGARLDLVATPDLDVFRGVRRARLRVRHLFPA